MEGVNDEESAALDLNGSDVKEGTNGFASKFKDQITTADGRVFYPCRFCNKVFPVKKTRTIHVKKCPAKDYILSVGDATQDDTNLPKKLDPQLDIPAPKKPPAKIDIQQNIILNKQLNVNEILSKSKSSIKLICHSQTNGAVLQNHTLILKEKNKSDEEFDSIAQRLESNSVTIIKKPKEVATGNAVETTCRECLKEFQSPLELLRHSRKCHSYPKVLMALSEVKKFYAAKDRSQCPICQKPLKVNFRSAFVKHLHTHTNEMKHSCNVCGKKFRRSDHMKAHEKRHIIEKK